MSDNDSAIASRTMSRTPGGGAPCHCPRAIALCKPRVRIVARQPESLRPARLCLLKGGADLVEHRADLRADKLDGDDNEDCNQAGDQRIFDRRHTGFIAKKVSNSKHGILLTLYGPLRFASRGGSKTEAFEVAAGSRPRCKIPPPDCQPLDWTPKILSTPACGL